MKGIVIRIFLCVEIHRRMHIGDISDIVIVNF